MTCSSPSWRPSLAPSEFLWRAWRGSRSQSLSESLTDLDWPTVRLCERLTVLRLCGLHSAPFSADRHEPLVGHSPLGNDRDRFPAPK